MIVGGMNGVTVINPIRLIDNVWLGVLVTPKHV